MSVDEFDESLFENPFVKAVAKLEKDRESIIADDILRKENEKKAREEEYTQRIIQAEKILREDCLEAINAIPPLELGKPNLTSFTTEAFLWFSEPGPLVRTDITEFTLAQSWLESLKVEGIDDEHTHSDFDSKLQAFRAFSGRIFSDENLDKVLAKIRKELGAAKMELKTMDGIDFQIRWHR